MQTATATNVSTSEHASDLTAVVPEFRAFIIGGKEIPIRQINVGMLPAVLRAVQPLAGLLTKREQVDIKNLFLLYADECLTLIAALSGQPRTWVDSLEIDQAIELFATLLEVNLDFFTQKVLPQLTGAMQKLTQSANANAALTAALGRTAFNSSSKPATATTTS